MALPTRPYRIRRVSRRSIWWALYPWRFQCRLCGRRGHHPNWAQAMTHASLHDCTPGSLW